MAIHYQLKEITKISRYLNKQINSYLNDSCVKYLKQNDNKYIF